MANVPLNPESPIKSHPVLGAEGEIAERRDVINDIAMADYEQAERVIAAEVDVMRAGINEKTAFSIARKNGSNIVNDSIEGVLGERVQAALYRVVGGNEYRDVRDIFDYKNYTSSVNYTHQQQNAFRRMLQKLEKGGRNAVSAVGGNNYVEDEVSRRFGDDVNIGARLNYLGQRILRDLTTLNAGQLNALAVALGLGGGTPTNVLADQILVHANQGNRHLMAIAYNGALWGAGVNLLSSDGFVDLMVFNYCHSREKIKLANHHVYNNDQLRSFWNELRTGAQSSPQSLALSNQIDEMLITDSLWSLDKKSLNRNPDGKALLSDIRARVQNMWAERYASNPGLLRAACNDVMVELQEIQNNELPEGDEDAAERERITTLVSESRPVIEDVGNQFSIIEQNAREVNRLNLLIPVADPALAGRYTIDITRLNNEITAASAKAKAGANKLITFIANSRLIIPPAILDASINPTITIPDFLSPPVGHSIPDLMTGYFNLLTHVNGLSGNKPKARLTPFQLLQRLCVRDYKRAFGLDPNDTTTFSEEANKAGMEAALERVKLADSSNLFRSGNQRAAEYRDSSIVGRSGKHLKKSVSWLQDKIGLEVVEMKEMTANKLLQQVIESEEGFHVFRGINKFTTSRDLKEILRLSGRQVSRATIERFVMTLESVISRFKEGKEDVQYDLMHIDWDLEELILVLNKMKNQLMTEETLKKLESIPEDRREQAFIKLLKTERENSARSEAQIYDEVNHPDAMWKLLLSKKKLKDTLNKESLEGRNKIKEAGIEQKKREIKQLTDQMNALPEGDAARTHFQTQIDNLERQIKIFQNQIDSAKDLYDRVSLARQYIRENKLSRKAKKAYIESVGLTQVYFKMDTNFKLQDAWSATKRGAKKVGGWTASMWSWSRDKFLNWDTTKNVALKSYAVGKWVATPIRSPLGWANRKGALAFRLIGRGISTCSRLPKRILATMSPSIMQSYLLGRITECKVAISKIQRTARKRAEDAKKPQNAYDKPGIAREINDLALRASNLNNEIDEYHKMATEKNIELGKVTYYNYASGEIVSEAA